MTTLLIVKAALWLRRRGGFKKLYPLFEVMARCRERAKVELAGKKLVSRAAMWFVILVWSLILVWVIWIIAALVFSSTH
jgi:hypothetical protein